MYFVWFLWFWLLFNWWFPSGRDALQFSASQEHIGVARKWSFWRINGPERYPWCHGNRENAGFPGGFHGTGTRILKRDHGRAVCKKQNSSFIVSFCMFVGEVFHPKVLCPTVVLFPTLFKGHNDGSSVGGWLHNVWNRQRLHQEVNTCTRWEGLSIKSELQYLDKITSLFFSHGVLTRCTFALLNLQLTLFECTNSFKMSHCLLWMFEAHPAAYMKFQSSKIPKPKGQEVNPS